MATLSSSKDVELVDLETHVALCAQRRLAIEARINSIEKKLTQAEERAERIRNIFLGGLISLAAGVGGTLFAVLFRQGVI